MNWKLKCLALHVLAHLPGRIGIHRWIQQRVTGRFLDDLSDEVLAVYEYHVRNFLKLQVPERSRVMEFGAGRNLLTALLLSSAGAGEVFAFDIDRLATVAQVNHVIGQLRTRGYAGNSWPDIADIDTDLKRSYRIYYMAPGDARATKLTADSVDFVCSTSTLEHINREDIIRIINECRRVCTPDALMSFIVDYHDHYASTDATITRFNFYRYPDSFWMLFNPSNHFQNRLRHCDYEALFAESGLITLENRVIIPADSEKGLGVVPLAADFSRYTIQDLAALNGFFLLRFARGVRNVAPEDPLVHTRSCVH